jgi:hypothetical protein
LNYTENVAILLSLLRKGREVALIHRNAKAFTAPRDKLVHTTHLIHLDEELPYIIHTDGGSSAIAAVLFKQDINGHTDIVDNCVGTDSCRTMILYM